MSEGAENPERILTREALTEPHRTVIDSEDNQLQILSKVLKDRIRRETAVQMHSVGGGPAGN